MTAATPNAPSPSSRRSPPTRVTRRALVTLIAGTPRLLLPFLLFTFTLAFPLRRPISQLMRTIPHHRNLPQFDLCGLPFIRFWKQGLDRPVFIAMSSMSRPKLLWIFDVSFRYRLLARLGTVEREGDHGY